MNTANITAATLASIAAATPMSREHGEAIAQAIKEASEPVQVQAIRPGKFVTIGGKIRARVLSVARNGVWVLRAATDGEYLRTGMDQIRERVSIKLLAAV